MELGNVFKKSLDDVSMMYPGVVEQKDVVFRATPMEDLKEFEKTIRIDGFIV